MLTPNYSQSVKQIRRSAKNSDENQIESTEHSLLTVLVWSGCSDPLGCNIWFTAKESIDKLFNAATGSEINTQIKQAISGQPFQELHLKRI